MKTPQTIEKTLKIAAKPHILFYSLPWLMVLLVLGTLAQKDMGIYEAQKIYFSSMIFWLGFIPLPGGFLTLSLIFINLTVKFIFFSEWSLQKSGIILSHFGVLLLLLGGLVTHKYAHETFMIIPEGESSAQTAEYRERVFTLTKDGTAILETPFSLNKNDYALAQQDVPFDASINFICDNCSMKFQDEDKIEQAKGLAEKVGLVQIEREKEEEANLAGIEITVSGLNDKMNGHYLLMESVSETVELTDGNAEYVLSLGRVKNALPFSIALEDFRKIDYPGTSKAQGYESDVIFQDNGVEWPITIRMNEPARYKGYTFYQSSFVQHPNKEITVLSVVHNIGAIFPYISCFVIFLGLLIHCIMRLRFQQQGTFT